MLPFSDPTVPSVVSIVVGGPVAGSWWGHPAGRLVYQIGEELEGDSDIQLVKLWRGKLTLVHRSLWSPLVRVGRARAPWQTTGLSEPGRLLLDFVERTRTIRSDALPTDFPAGSHAFRPALRDLERRLLVLTRSVHTTTGAHALEAESWAAWSTRVRPVRFVGSVESAQLLLENAARRLAPNSDPRRAFPWK